MRQRMKDSVLSVWCFFAAILFLSVAFAAPAAAKGEILRYAVKHGDLKTLDPHQATGSQDRILVEMMFNALLRYKPGTLSAATIEPDLATAWEQSADGRSWTFHLRDNVFFHPWEGNPSNQLTSADVVFSLKRAADPKTSAFSSDYAGMTFEAPDPRTVKVTLDKARSPALFLPALANRGGGLVVCKKALEDKGADWAKTHPIGTGPFLFTSYEPMQMTQLAANSRYFRGAPRLGGVEYRYMPDLASRELALEKGELHVIEGPREQAWAENMAKKRGIVVDTLPSDSTVVVHFNMTVAPLNDIRIRKAVAHALNISEWVALYGSKFSIPIYSFVPPGMPGALTRQEAAGAGVRYDYNLETARKLMSQAGYAKGLELKVFTSESDTYKRAYEIMQAQLKKIGINLQLSVVDHPTFHQRIRQNLDPIVIYESGRPNLDVILTQFYKASSEVVKGEKPVTNFSHYGAVDANGDGKVDGIDDLIDKAKSELDSKKQVELWKQAEIKILKDVAAIPTISFGYLFGRRAEVDWGYSFVTMADGPKVIETTQLLKK